MKRIYFCIVVLTLVSACSREPESDEPVFDLAAGEAIARADCSACHGMDGRGTTSEIPNLTAQPVQYLIEAMHAYRDGGRLHAALQDMTTGMSEADVANIAAYYASQPPLEHDGNQGTIEASNSESTVVAVLCEECHGEKGISTMQGVPNLAGQQPAYLIASTLEYKSGTRGHENMGEMLTELDQVDVEKMAMYFASQSAPMRETPPFGDPVAGKADSASCGKCHGASGVSHKAMVPSLAAQEPVYLANASKAYHNNERNEESQMPVKTDEQLNNIAAYYATQEMTASVEDESTAKEMAKTCDRCHNPPSGNRNPNTPSLRGQSYEYLVKSMKEYRDSDRENSMMHKMSARYSDEMIDTLATYYASQ
jgi:cytochrome c553